MALRTADWWGDYIRLMEEETDPSVFFGSGPDGMEPGEPSLHPLEALFPDGEAYDIQVTATERGVLFRVEDPVREESGLRRSLEEAAGVSSPEPGLRVVTDMPYSYLGTSVISGDLDGDGLEDLVAGAPGTSEPGRPQMGSVYIITGDTLKDRSLLNVSEADQVLVGPDPSGRFGWALALVDLNADGRADLAVSSPSSGAEDLELFGKVWVFFGCEGEDLFSSSPDLEIQGGDTYTRLGLSLGSGDANGDGYDDLLVGAPYARAGGEQRGLTLLYLADNMLERGTVWGPADAAWQLNGERDYDWFGTHLGVVPRPGNEPLVLIGAPGTDTGGAQASGRLYAYPADGPDPLNPVFTITGEREFEKVGAAFAVADLYGGGSVVLALAAPTRGVDPLRQAGEVFLLDMEHLEGNALLEDLSGAFVLTGDREFGRMGWRIATGDVSRDGTADLLVTQPWLGDPIHPMRGGAALWKGGAFPAGGTRLPFRADERILGTTDRARLGDAARMADVNGDGLDDLVMAAGRDSGLALYGGAVSIYFTPACRDWDEDGFGDPAAVSCRIEGTDCDDDPSDDPEGCSHCACGTQSCAGCARCVHPGAREFPLDAYDSNCNGETDCFIAQAAFGSELSGKIHVLRAFRDRVLLACGPGTALVEAYYEHGPGLARWVGGSEVLRRVVRVLLMPLVGLASLLI